MYMQRKRVCSFTDPSFAFVEGAVLNSVAVAKRADIHMQMQEEGTERCEDQHLLSLL